MKKNPISTRKIFPSSQVPPSSFITYAVIVLIFVLFISFMLFDLDRFGMREVNARGCFMEDHP